MIHIIIGRQGSGKTLFAVRMAYEEHKKGKTIYSNVKLNFPHKPMNYNDIIDCKYEDAVVLIDEAHQLLSSRASMSKVNKEICDSFLSMIRKKSINLICTTQTLRKIDIRLYEEASYNYLCSKFGYIKNKFVEIVSDINLPLDVPIMIKVVRFDTFSGEANEIFFSGNELFELYDTKQIIRIKGLDDV